MTQNKPLNKLLRKAEGELNPSTALHSEAVEQTDLLGEIKETLKESVSGEKAQKVNNVAEFVTGFLQSIKGDKGDTPEKGKDYLTEKEISEIKEEITPVKGEDYYTEEDKQEIVELATPQKGVHYFDGEDGRDGIDGKDGESIKGDKGDKGDPGKDGKDGRNPEPKEVISEIKKLKGNDRLDITDIRNSEQITSAIGKMKSLETDGFRFNGKKYKFSELMHGGGTTSVDVQSVTGTSPIIVDNTDTANPIITIQQANTTDDGYLSSTDWDTFNNKQDALTLTTSGTSGAATLVGATLNIPQYQAAGTYVTSVTGTANRITSTGGTTPVIDISSSYVGQSSITTLGTIATGVWQGTAVGDTYITNTLTGKSVNGVTLVNGGTSTLYLSQDGTYTTPASGGSPGGSDTQIQFNDSSAFGGDSGFTYNKTSNVVSINGAGSGQIGALNITRGDSVNQYIVLTESASSTGSAYLTFAGSNPGAMAMGALYTAGVPTSYVFTDTGGTPLMEIDEATGNIEMVGSLGLTGNRVSKGWFTDLQVTNAIAGSITGNAATVTNGVYTTGADTVYLTPATAATTYQPLDAQLTSLAGLSYTGNSLKVVRVNVGETAFELATITAGDVSKVGTPANNQLGVWTGDGTIEGDAALTFDTTTDTLATTLITATTVTANLTGNVTGNVSGSAATVTGAAQTAITSLGTLTALQVDNVNINGNTISSTAGTDLLITPLAGQQLILDGTIEIDAGIVTGITSLGLTGTRVTAGFFTDLAVTNTITGSISGNAATVTTNANLTGIVTSTGNATAIADKAISYTKLADGTDGNLITWDSSGVAALVATGTSGQVLTSNGAGAAPTFQTAGGGASPAEAQAITVTLSSANIMAMFGTPVTLIPAPGAGKLIQVDEVVVSFIYNSIAYANGSELRIRYSGSGTDLFSTIADTGPMRGTASFINAALAIGGAGGTIAVTSLTNTAIVATNTGSAFTDGNSTMKIFLRYRIITL